MERGRDFGQLAVERRVIEPAQLRDALEEQRRLRRKGQRPFLGEVLVELGMISLEQLFVLLDAARGYREHASESDEAPRFGDVAVRKNYVTAVQLFGCLQLQRDEDLTGLPHRPIGEILLQKGYLTAWELDDVRVTLVDLELSDVRTGETPSEGIRTKGVDWRGEFPEPMPGSTAATRRLELVPAREIRKGVSAPVSSELPRIANVMTPVPVTTSPYATLAQARAAAEGRGVRHVLVVDADDLVGVLHVAELVEAPANALVLRLMRTPVVSVSAHSSVADAVRLMNDTGLDCLPVMVGALLVGVITPEELRRAGV